MSLDSFNQVQKDVTLENKHDQSWSIPLNDSNDIMNGSIPLSASNDVGVKPVLDSPNELIIRIITWNQQARDPPPPDVMKEQLLPENRYDIIVFGAEECENSILMSTFNPSKTKWEDELGIAVGPDYSMIRSHALVSTHM